MENENKKIGLLSGNILKIIACISMALDHAGLLLCPSIIAFRVLGRLAFPLFAFFIAEGCKYTKNRTKHFLLIFSCGLVFMIGEYIFTKVAYVNVFMTFSASILIIYALEYVKFCIFNNEIKPFCIILSILIFVIVTTGIIVSTFYVHYDYDLLGIMIPVALSVFSFSRDIQNVPKFLKVLDNHFVKVAVLIPLLIGLSFTVGSFPAFVQPHGLVSCALLLLYNEKRGRFNLKYVFYAFYPLHIAVIYAVYMFLSL